MVLTIFEFQALLNTVLDFVLGGVTKRSNANYNVNVCLIPQCHSNWNFEKLQVHKVILLLQRACVPATDVRKR